MAAEAPAITAICCLPLTGLPKTALVVGDPGRALKIAEIAKAKFGIDYVVLAKNREYHTFVVVWNGKKIVVGSHGIGGGGASCYFEELVQAGVTTIVRAGTCGSFDAKIREGGLIVATGAVRLDGVSDRIVPIQYPAISHYEVVNALLAAVQKRVAAVKDVPSWGIGVIATVGHFYDGPLGNQNRLWEASRVLGIEMEASVLLTIGGIRGIRTGCLANVDNYIFERELSGTYAPHRDVVLQGTTRMIEIAMDAMAALSSDQVTVN